MTLPTESYRNSQEARDQVRISAAKLIITANKKRKVKTPEWVQRLAAGDVNARPSQQEGSPA